MDGLKTFHSRRAVLKGGATLAAAATLGGFGSARALAQSVPELTTLRSTSKSWLWAAEDFATASGFFEQAGVNVISNASNRGTNVAALQGGGVDIVLGDPGEAMRARGQNLKIKTFISMVNRYASHVLLKQSILDEAGVTADSPVADKVALLKGRKLGTTGPGAAPDALLRYLAQEGGFNPERDMQLISIQGGGPGMLAALDQNAIDGFCLSSPTADLAVQRSGCGYLFQMALQPPPFLAEYQYIIASTAESTIAEKRPALVAYAKGIALSLKAIADDPEAFKTWAKGWFDGMDPQIFDTAFSNNGRIYAADPVPTEPLYGKNIEFISLVNESMGAAPVSPDLTFDVMVDSTIAQEAVASL